MAKNEYLKFWKCRHCHGTGKVIAGRIGEPRIEKCADCDGTGNALVNGEDERYKRKIAEIEAKR